MDAQETRIYTAVIISVVIIGIIIVYFIISILRQQRKYVELHKLNILAEITQLEKERGRIAADLHDELGPLLSAVKMKINTFELSDKEDKIQVENTNDHIDQILKRIREISFDLMPNSLLRKGLVTAVKEFVDYLNNDGNIKFNFQSEKTIMVNEAVSINVYRIVQELVHNTIKHARASEVRIELKMTKNGLLLTFNDNGVGFDYSKESSGNIGFGLRSLLNRTEIVEGKMYLHSKIGKGTAYSFDIPV